MFFRACDARLLFALGLSIGLATACDQPQSTVPSGGSLAASPTQASSDEPGVEADSPIIHSVEFKPPNLLPGRSIRAHVKAIDPAGRHIRLSFDWTLNGRPVEANGEQYTLPALARRGDRVAVDVTASNAGASSLPFRLASRIANRRPSMTEIRIRTESDGGGRWVAEPIAEDPDGDRLSFTYLWILNGQDSEFRDSTLDQSSAARGDKVKLKAWASDGLSKSLPLESAPFGVGNSPPEIVSTPPNMDESGLFLYVVRATDPDGDTALDYSLEKGPQGMTIDSKSGELRWQATLQNAGEHEVRIAVDDRQGGSSRQGFFVQVEMVLPPPRLGGG
ncbi:MAG: Ig domain-containing protein [Myxococcota bacterium]|nr:Ig domain-containing protein [Myxococcota bacterium]